MVGVGAFLFLALAFVGFLQEQSAPTEPPAVNVPDYPPAAAAAPASAVTMANFNRVRTGMTYAQVVAILGEPTELMSEAEVAGQRSSVFMWKADNWLGNATLTFSNGTVMAKAQVGLE